jgi:hypothetical protein
MKSKRLYTFSITLLLFNLFGLYTLPTLEMYDDGIRKVSDGVVFYRHNLDGPYQVNVLEVDMNDQSNRLVAWRSGGLVSTTQQLKDATMNGKKALAAINADFFSFQSTLPIGNQVTDGVWVHGINSRRAHVLIDSNQKFKFMPVSFMGSITDKSGNTVAITGVNRHRANNQSMIYNHHYGWEKSRNDSSGVELSIRLLEGQKWVAGNTLKVEVTAKSNGSLKGDYHDHLISIGVEHSSYSFYRHISVSDTLELFLGFTNASLKGIDQVIGGGGIILRNSKNVSTESIEYERIAESFLTTKHPRTVVATNQAGTKLWLLAIDGRQSVSIGMNFDDMADYLLKLGASDAINLDGGGSTTLAIGSEVVNSPSDPTGERAVANILLIEQVD